METAAAVVIGIVLLGGAVALLMAVMVAWNDAWEEGEGWLRAVGVTVGALAIVFFVVWLSTVIVGDDGQPDDVHGWRDGSGPATTCTYEVRQEPYMIGKTTYFRDATYTVCRDAK